MTLLRLAGFRAALAYTAVLLIAMALVLGLLYGRLADELQRMQDNLIWREAASLSLIHRRDGVRGLAQAVNLVERGQGRYVRLSDGLGQFIAGNLAIFPQPEATDANGWLRFTDDTRPVRARILQIDADLMLLVGQDISDGENLLASARRSFALALLAILLIGLGGGAFLARRGLKRVEAIGADLRPVMEGDLSARLPAYEGGAEWQFLQAQINEMVARLENLMQATRAVGDNLAHDLRAPLSRLRTRLESLLVAETDSEKTGHLGAAIEDVDALLKSFNALLTLSRLESGVSRLVRQPIALDDLVTELHDLYAPVFEAQNMALTCRMEPGLVVQGNGELLAQALVNVLENVLVHAAIADSDVLLSASKTDNGVTLSLADNGPGIAAEARDAALGRFVQLDASRSKGGNGLGLSLVAAICAHHAGRLELADNNPGLKLLMHLPVEGA